MQSLLKIVTEHPVWVLVGVFVVTAFLISKLVDLESGELQITLDPSIDRLLPEDDEARGFYEQARESFEMDHSTREPREESRKVPGKSRVSDNKILSQARTSR